MTISRKAWNAAAKRAAEREALELVARKLFDFISAYQTPGIDGLLMGVAAGRMLAHGASKAEVRDILEHAIAGLPELTSVGGAS
jgi:hypothetical protein